VQANISLEEVKGEIKEIIDPRAHVRRLMQLSPIATCFDQTEITDLARKAEKIMIGWLSDQPRSDPIASLCNLEFL
jgi:hypothetical protein